MLQSPWLNRLSAGFIVGLFIVLIVIRWNRPIESDVERMLQHASNLLAAEQFDEAGELAAKIMREYPARNEAYLLLARAGARLKRTQPSVHRQPCDRPLAVDAPLDQIYDHADRLLDAGKDDFFHEVIPTNSELLLIEGSRQVVILHP